MFEKMIVILISPMICYVPRRTDENGLRKVGPVSKTMMKVFFATPRPLLYLFFVLVDLVIVWNVGLLLLDYCLSFFSWLEHGCGQYEFKSFFTLTSFFKNIFSNW